MQPRTVLLLEAAIAFIAWILIAWWLWPRLVSMHELVLAAGFDALEREAVIRVVLLVVVEITLLTVATERTLRYRRGEGGQEP